MSKQSFFVRWFVCGARKDQDSCTSPELGNPVCEQTLDHKRTLDSTSASEGQHTEAAVASRSSDCRSASLRVFLTSSPTKLLGTGSACTRATKELQRSSPMLRSLGSIHPITAAEEETSSGKNAAPRTVLGSLRVWNDRRVSSPTGGDPSPS
jgi:hypothetical protein